MEYLQGLTPEELEYMPVIIEEPSIEIQLNLDANPLEDMDIPLPCTNDELYIIESEGSKVNLMKYTDNDGIRADEILDAHNNNSSMEIEKNSLNPMNENIQRKEKLPRIGKWRFK